MDTNDYISAEHRVEMLIPLVRKYMGIDESKIYFSGETEKDGIQLEFGYVKHEPSPGVNSTAMIDMRLQQEDTLYVLSASEAASGMRIHELFKTELGKDSDYIDADTQVELTKAVLAEIYSIVEQAIK